MAFPLVPLAIAGAGAGLSKLFGGKSSQKRDTTYNGPSRIASRMEATGGKEYYDKLLKRVEGQGVGYGNDYVSTANPQVANLRNTFTSYTIPELNSELSRTGRRKGSGGFDQIKRAYQDQTLAENDIVSRLAQRQSEASREDMNNALYGIGEFNASEANLRNDFADSEYRKYLGEIGVEDTRRQRADEETNRLLMTPYSAYSNSMEADSLKRLLDRSLNESPKQDPMDIFRSASRPKLSSRSILRRYGI